MSSDAENGSDSSSITVDWEGPNDPAKPSNWSPARKWTIVVTTSLCTFIVSFGSSVMSATRSQLQKEFGASNDETLLPVSLYVVGFALGPMVWGPASELYGKNRPLWIGYFLFCIFQIPCAVAQDLSVLLVFRLLAGLAGSSTLAIIGGMFVDFLVEPSQRGISTAIFSLGTFCGPAAGPIIGNIATVKIGWRWTAWITLIGAAFFGILGFLVTTETSDTAILRRKAREIRKTSGGSVHVHTKGDKPTAAVFIQKYLTRPMRMIIREPILIFFTIHMSLAYGIIYLTFTLVPFSFVRGRGWSAITGSLPFLGIFLGVVLACLLLAFHSIYYIPLRFAETQSHLPERRLPPMIVGSFLLPGGLFWFAWTSDPKISWVPHALAGIFIGAGSVLVLMSGIVYLIEVYLAQANSALAVNNMARSAFAAAFPFFATDLFTAVGIDVGGSILGGVCVGLIPFPILFWRYGQKIRGWSKYASS